MKTLLTIVVLALSASIPAEAVTVSTAADLVTAINNNNGSSSGGGVIIMNAGTYNLSSSLHASADPNIGIDIVKPITIQAAAGASPVINFPVYILMRVQASNSIIDGITLAGAQFGVQLQDVNGINNHTVSNTILRRLSVSTTGMGGQAISGGGVLDSIIEYCTVTSTYNAGIVVDVGPGPQASHSLRNLIVNNTVTNTGSGSGIALQLSDYNTVAGNTITNTTFDGVFVNGGQHNYIGQNIITNPHNGVTLTKYTNSPVTQSNRNYVGNNSLALNGKSGSDALWFNYDSNYNMAFLNEGYNSQEAGMALFNSVGNYIRANNLHNNPNGGIVVRKDPDSGATVPTRNSIQQNYFHDHPANGGITTSTETLNDYGFNYISGDPSQISQPIGGIVTAATTNSVFYSNVIRDLRQAEQLETSTTGAVFYLNRHINTVNHYVLSNSSAQFDSGSTILGGNYYSDFSSANGNPSNGATPYINIIDRNGAPVSPPDRYPYASESLGKIYSIGVKLPTAGSYLAVGTSKTIAWSSQGCVLVDIFLLNSNGSLNTTIASNVADYGYYRWKVPSIASGSYAVRVDCKTSSGAATGKLSYGQLFNVMPADLVLLSPQTSLITDAGSKMQISWAKSSAIPSVDVYIRYADNQPYSLIQAGVTADFLTITTPTVTSNRVSAKILYSSTYADSTDGWFTIRGSSSGQITAPSSADNLYVGTPYLVEWASPQNTDYVTIDLVGSATKNIVTQLADFSSYLMLVPDLQGQSASLRVTFYNAAGTVLQQISSQPMPVVNSSSQPNALAIYGGSGQSAPINTTFPTPLQVQVTNSGGGGIAGVAVTFTQPAAGAGGSFAGASTVVTNASGIATAPSFTANGVVGGYNVTASAGALSASFTLTNTAAPTAVQTNVGFYNNGAFALDANGNGHYDGSGGGDKTFFFAAPQPGDIAIYGDWNGDGRTKVGLYRAGFWLLDYNGDGVFDVNNGDKFYGYGGDATQYLPVVGDWNHDGRTKIGFFHNGFWQLDYNGNGVYDPGIDKFYGFGQPGDIPLVGDWNHDGRTKIGLFRNGYFQLDYDGDGSNTAADKFYFFIGPYDPVDKPVIGDWSGNGFSKIGLNRRGFWFLDYNGNGTFDGYQASQPVGPDKFYGYGGNTGEIPIVGDWNGSGTTKIGFYLNGFWALDYNGNGTNDGPNGGDRFIAFSSASAVDQPVIGKW